MKTAAHIDYLDGWRGLSIVFVLQGHFLRLPGVDLGGFGVWMFFVLSGLLMGQILFVKKQRLALFYKRRVSRIMPAFVLFVLTVAIVDAIFWHKSTWVEWLATLAFLRTYLPLTHGIWDTGLPIGHLWSLNVEEHAYLLMSLLTLCVSSTRRAGFVLAVVAGVTVAIGFVYVRLGTAAPHWGALGTEVAGTYVFLAAGYALLRRASASGGTSHIPVLALVAAVCVTKTGIWWLIPVAVPPLLAIAVVQLDRAPKWWRHFLATPALQAFGRASFSLYLWQQPFYAFQNDFPGGSVFALIAACLVGYLSYRYVELPARMWLNGNWAK